jgi:phage replication O-like protein O
MSPQKENGFTAIAHEILENAAMYKLNGTQFRILLLVWRYTYGFGRTQADLAVSFLAKGLNVNQRQIQRELTAMIEMGLLIEVQKPSFNKRRIIKFNKSFSQQVTNKTSHDVIDVTTDVGLDMTTGVGLDTQDIKHIDNNINIAFDDKIKNEVNKKSKMYTDEFEEIYKLYPRPENKKQTFINYKKLLKEYKHNELINCVKKYIKAKKGTDKQYLTTSSNFFGNKAVYLDFIEQDSNVVQLPKNEDWRNVIWEKK